MKNQENNNMKKAAILAGLATMVGFVAFKVGEVLIERNGEKLAAEEGDQLFLNDKLITADGSSANIMLNDANSLDIGPGRSVLLDSSIVVNPDDLDTAAGEEMVGSSAFIDAYLSRGASEGSAESNPLSGAGGAGSKGTVYDPDNVLGEQSLAGSTDIFIGDPLEAVDDQYTMDEDGVLHGTTGLNDTATSGLYQLESVPANGTVEMNSDGTFTYTPNANFNGVDSFTYEVRDVTGNASVASVSVVVNPVADFITDLHVEIGDPVVFDAKTDLDDFSFSTPDTGSTIVYHDGNNSGSGSILGIDSGSAHPTDQNEINAGETLDVTLDAGYVTRLALEVKNIVGENIEVTITDIDGNESVWTFYKQSATSDIVTTVDGQVIDMVDLSGGTTGNPAEYLVITNDIPFNTFSLSGLESTTGGNEGFALVNITNDIEIPGMIFNYPLIIDSEMFEMEGSDVVTNVTLSALPDGAVLSGDVVDNGNGTWTVELGDTIDVILTTPTELPEGYTPTIEATTVDGGDSALSVLGGTLDTNIIGTNDADFIEVSADSSTVKARGGDDTIVYNESASSLDGGQGEDTLLVQNENIDFNSITNISSIEAIDLSSVSSNDLSNLSVEDVLDMTDKDNILKIEGDSNDSVGLTSEWTESGTSGGYTVYTDTGSNATVTLQIDENVDVVIAES